MKHSLYGKVLDRFGGEKKRDASRVAIQSIAASAAVYLLMRWAGLPEISWAVIAALFAIHLNFDSTLVTAIGRLASTVLGTGLGLLLVYFAGGPEMTLPRLIVAAGVMNAVGALRPTLRYGAVPAAVIALEQKTGLTGDSLQLALAVFIGTGMGAVSSIVVWPEFGRQRALRHLICAVQACRDLVEVSVAEILDPRDRNFSTLHSRFLGHLQKAKSVAADTRLWPRLAGATILFDIADSVERLWHSLSIVDRIVHDPAMRIAPEDFDAIEPQVRKVQRSAIQYLESIISRLRTGRRTADHRQLARRLAEARAISDRLLDRAGQHPGNRAVQSLLFAFYEIADNLSEMDSLAAGAERSRSDASRRTVLFRLTRELRS